MITSLFCGTTAQVAGSLIESVAGAAEDIAHLVTHQIFDFGAGRAEIFARVEFLRVFGQDLADGRGHGEAEIGINIDFGATEAARDFDVSL